MLSSKWAFPISCLGLIFVTNISNVQGINCYQCLNNGGNATEDNTCTSALSSGTTRKCQPYEPYCVKMIGKVNGTDVVLRACGDLNWERALKSTDKCIQASTVQDFHFKLSDGRDIRPDIEDGGLCVCDTDKCNAGNSILASVIVTSIITFSAILLTTT